VSSSICRVQGLNSERPFANDGGRRPAVGQHRLRPSRLDCVVVIEILVVDWAVIDPRPVRTRPSFKLVTGISTGALIAPFAFLGSDYDPQLRTGVKAGHLAAPQGLALTAFGRARVAHLRVGGWWSAPIGKR
jgi:hypothetical protein